jgi:acetyl-CoA carboxylase biotin carboxylase subunit
MSTKKIKKVLVANRGEIAVRVMRTCKNLGIKTVAVYSEADKKALHVQVADEAYLIGPAASNESYLVIEKIIDVAKKSGADAIHPGYGFLSEKAPFSQACKDAGITFLGPDPYPIEAMGDKIAARKVAESVEMPMVPGLKRPLESVDEARKLANEFGYPVLLKASAGGGGKGMRVVEKESEIESAYERAASEAMKAFGDDSMYIEKYLRQARHVEVQIACDNHGNGIHLYERECSLQRRHQKVVEEAPFTFIKPETREKMTAAALRLADKVGYSGVGTIEFLVDDDQNFYFLEMNTRLQVEHPVSELITGIDLVELQILIGENKELPLTQDQVKLNGCAIECRLYAEDPDNNFFPSPGTISWMTVPEGPGIRHDTGVYEGATIPIFYDPMIAKLVVWAPTRENAIQKMRQALKEYEIGGFKNNISFLRTILDHPEYIKGDVYTRFIEERPELLEKKETKDLPEWILGLAAFDKFGQKSASTNSSQDTGKPSVSPWKMQGIREGLNRRL